MAKISRVGGFTDATARGFVSPADALRARGKLGPYDIEFELVDPDDVDSVTGALTGEPGTTPAGGHAVDDDVATARVEPEEEESWPGSSSETSPEKPPTNDEPSKPSPRRPARSGGRPSASTKASGTAPTGTTSGPETAA
ncbi:hypothetical protein [Promicromonospora sp. NPDC023805]|uniref:hypothetical protein n=1 Tax=Promicromonospora sp. NPDC023805 TaxID=3154696 RepID=UPI0033DF85D5